MSAILELKLEHLEPPSNYFIVVKLTLFDECFTIFNEFGNIFYFPNVDDVKNATKNQA